MYYVAIGFYTTQLLYIMYHNFRAFQ
jgi:hypothetical protein